MNPYERNSRTRNPREDANIFSRLSFIYTKDLFKKGVKNDLEDEDIYEVIRSFNSQRCGDKLEKQWNHENKQAMPPSIYKLLWKRYGFRYIAIGLVDLVFKISSGIILPHITSTFISCFKPGQTELSQQDTYLYAMYIMAFIISYCVYFHNYIQWVQEFSIEMRTAMSSLLYRKALKLTPSALNEISLGNIVTLITKDLNSFEKSILSFNDTWNAIVQTIFISYILYVKIGFVAFIGIGILLSAVPLQVILGKYVSKLRLSTSKKSDDRLQMTQETLSTIRIIKMYTWERFFSKQISSARKKEMNKMLYSFFLKSIMILVGITFSKFSFYALIMSYIWMGYATNTEWLFYVLALFRDLEFNLGILIPWGMGEVAMLHSALIRINRILVAEELKYFPVVKEKVSDPYVEIIKAEVHINNHKILDDISVRINSGLTIITGAVGSGKSSFLKAVIQDYPLTNGKVDTRGRISYASQDSWLFPSTIRQNIVFNEKYDEKRYRDVVKACALEYDFNLLEDGDQTIVSDRGMNLSGGQQARINLARAIYKDSEIYLLDDSLTALDPQVQDSIFEECIRRFLAKKIVILVSQIAHHIDQADTIIILSNGKIKFNGKPSKELLKEIDATALSEDNSLEVENNLPNKFDEGGTENIGENDVLLKNEHVGKERTVYGEIKKTGEVDYLTYKKYFNYGGGFMVMLLYGIIFGLSQGSKSYADKLLTQWVNEKEKVLSIQKNLTQLHGANYSSILAETTSEIKSLNEAAATESFQLYLYSIMICMTTIATFVKEYAVLSYCRKASVNIHKAMLGSMMTAPMAFFDTHFIGNILNRFSQDMNNVDENLPLVFSEVFRVLFSVSGVMYLLFSVQWTFFIHSSLFLGTLLVLKKIYIPTGRSVKRLEAASRSPMIGHLKSTLEGLPTLRASGAQNILIDEFDKHQNVFTSAHYISLTTSRAFSFVMDFCCSLFITSVVARFAFFDSGTTIGDVGLAVTQVFLLAGDVDWGIRQWADLENLMTSVERILEYTDVKSETKDGAEIKDWPSKGAITYQNVCLSYNNKEKILKNLSFQMNAKEKIGIVGRTGAGKSSVILSLFRLYNFEGKVIIDDVDIKTVSLQFLRHKLAIIPQDPILFTGTIRTNLDPFEEFDDDDLWKVLDKVNLKGAISNLNMLTNNSHSTFSSGEKQLICLARAILKKVKIIILDEATSNMDHETDELLNSCVKENFSNCTMLIIAHRLQSVLECDKVMVLDKGYMKEFDSPKVLLGNKNGYFYKMVHQAGLLQ